MASEGEATLGLDDIMATLMTMGFEFKDCQDAITNGKLTVQAAVEWILSGKPNNVAADQPTLTLNQNQRQPTGPLGDRSNPFVERNFTPLETQISASTSSQDVDVDMTDSSIVSRSHLSGKQQQIKHDFEEKERVVARKKVQDEKRKQKLDKERILKEIQADREKLKLTKQAKPSNSVPAKPTTENEPQDAAASNKDSNSDDSTLIQVRLPSGEMFRQTFSSAATLNNVWDAVFNKIKRAMLAHQGFIQPFPRREFLKEEMGQTLKDLGLTPSGSLVLKKKDVGQASAAEEVPVEQNVDLGVADMQAVGEAEEGEEENYEDDVPMEERAPGQHNWGRGFRVDDENANPAEQMDIAEAAQAVAHNPFDNEDGMFDEEEEAGPAFEGFGMRLVPEGVPADDGHHLLRRAADMAALAAAQRFAQPPPVVEPEPLKSQSELKYNAHTLQDLGMIALAKRITDPRTPLFSMTGLSNDLLQAFLTYLKKEKLLNPKILLLMPSYLSKLNLDSYSYTTNELLHAARVLVNLNNLSLSSCSLITDAGLLSIKGMKVLKSLSLQDCGQITDCCFSALSELPLLQSLNLESTKVTNKGISQFAGSGACPLLAHLNLSRTSITHAIIPSLAKFEHLKSLCVKQNRICSLSGIQSISSLESLDVSDTDIVSDSVLCLAGLPFLRYLCLTGTQELVGDTALSYMKDFNLTSIALPCRVSTTDIGMSYITGFTLSALDLTNYTNVGDAGMLSVGQIISLKTLLLTNTRVSNEGMIHLAGLKNLEVLSIDKTSVSAAGVAVVENFKLLTELSLAATSVTSDLLKQGVLNNCAMLSKLNLSRTFVGDRGLECLKLPNLTLLNLDCTRAHEYIESTVRLNCPNVKRITLANLTGVPEDEEI